MPLDAVHPRLVTALGAGAVGLLVVSLAACSSSGGSKSGGTTTAAKTANVTITAAKGCETDHTTFAAGGVTFMIKNQDATAVSEVELLSGEQIVGEKENIPPGLGGQFAVSVDAGKYTLYCPGATPEKSTITVTGKAAAVDDNIAALLKTATADYKVYVDRQVGYLLDGVKKLNTALHGTDLAAAQKAYKLARPFYEKIEPVAETFVNGKQNLDADIDAREGDVPASQFYGFHRIEKGLFQANSLAGLTAFGDKLVTDVTTLQTKTAELTYKAPDLANGAQELLDEVASSKITGEEERYSHIDVLDMANNIEGSEQAFADLQPALNKIDPSLATTIAGTFTSLVNLVNTYRSGSDPSGYVLYSTLTDADRKALSAAVKAVAEPLSQVGSKVANA
jgi:iron uptake system component EfeO